MSSPDWNKPIPKDDPVLAEIQGNWLKGHGRDNTRNLFFKFSDPVKSKAFVTALGKLITYTNDQLVQTAAFKQIGRVDQTLLVAFFTASGYKKLGVPVAKLPPDPKFQAGMKASQAALHDPLVANWEGLFREEIDVLVLVAGDYDKWLQDKVDEVLALAKTNAVSLLGIETGLAVRNSANQGIEHFGYVDGRSQPLFYAPDIDSEKLRIDAELITPEWDFVFKPRQFLDLYPDDTVRGSYFVFRKLEQNVRGFKTHEQDLATYLDLEGEDRERAGAMVVGRFEDGTPVTTYDEARAPEGAVPNAFDYSKDTDGLRCPFSAHIRKVNPREAGSAFRDPIMARRGIPFGQRDHHPNDPIPLEDLPTGGVGLLFQAYMSSLVKQFEFTQISWANNATFEKPGTGVDPIIGEGDIGHEQWPLVYGEGPLVKFDFANFVTMKGGEYFHAPAKLFFTTLTFK